MLPATLPLFPLPNVVLFPDVFLPLHIFEPRYRAMVADALAGDRLIGVVLMKSEKQEDVDAAGRAPIYPVGTAGLISHVDKLPDGRFNIVLQGIEKFRVLREVGDRPYREAETIAMPEAMPAEAKAFLRQERAKLEALLLPEGGSDVTFPSSLQDGDLVNALSQYLELLPVERQALLERDNALERCRGLIELMEIQAMVTRQSMHGGSVH